MKFFGLKQKENDKEVAQARAELEKNSDRIKEQKQLIKDSLDDVLKSLIERHKERKDNG